LAAAEARNVAVSIEVRLGGHTVFSYTMPDASPANADWARRKCNTVELMHRSSYAVGRAAPRDGLTAIQRMGLDPRDYAEAGGGFPIAVAGSGCINTLPFRLPQREDHAWWSRCWPNSPASRSSGAGCREPHAASFRIDDRVRPQAASSLPP
jgi:uncharacterized protein (UPF0303 family)